MNIKKECFVVVHCWLPMDGSKTYTNSGGAAITNGLGKDQAHVGHAAISIHDVNGDKHSYEYFSFWPTVDAPGLNAVPGLFVDLAIDVSTKGENRKPDAQIIFYSLNKTLIKNHIERLKKKLNQNNLKWCVTCNLADNSNDDPIQNCSSLSWNLLLSGGLRAICNVSSSRSGPRNPALRKKYKCDEGSILDGFFDDAFWRDWFVSPNYILHLAAAAKERELALHPITSSYDTDVEKWVDAITTTAITNAPIRAAAFPFANGFELVQVTVSTIPSSKRVKPIKPNRYLLNNPNNPGDIEYLSPPQITYFGTPSLASSRLIDPVPCVAELPNLSLLTVDYSGTLKKWDIAKAQEITSSQIPNLGRDEIHHGELFQDKFLVYSCGSLSRLGTHIFDIDSQKDVVVSSKNLGQLYKLNETMALVVFIQEKFNLYLLDITANALTLLTPNWKGSPFLFHKILVLSNNDLAIIRDVIRAQIGTQVIDIYSIENGALKLKSTIDLDTGPFDNISPQFRTVRAFCELSNGNIFIASIGGFSNRYSPDTIDSFAQVYDRKTGKCLHTMSSAISFDPVVTLGKHYVASPAIRSNTDPQVRFKFTIWDTRLLHAQPVHPAVKEKLVALKLLSTGQLIGITDQHTIALLTFPANQLQQKAVTGVAGKTNFFQAPPSAIPPPAAAAPVAKYPSTF